MNTTQRRIARDIPHQQTTKTYPAKLRNRPAYSPQGDETSELAGNVAIPIHVQTDTSFRFPNNISEQPFQLLLDIRTSSALLAGHEGRDMR